MTKFIEERISELEIVSTELTWRLFMEELLGRVRDRLTLLYDLRKDYPKEGISHLIILHLKLKNLIQKCKTVSSEKGSSLYGELLSMDGGLEKEVNKQMEEIIRDIEKEDIREEIKRVLTEKLISAEDRKKLEEISKAYR